MIAGMQVAAMRDELGLNETRLNQCHPFFKLNCEAVECALPVPQRHRPLLADIVECRVKQLADGLIGRVELRVLMVFRRLILIDSMASVV